MKLIRDFQKEFNISDTQLQWGIAGLLIVGFFAGICVGLNSL